MRGQRSSGGGTHQQGNEMRPVWDPEGKYSLYGFSRQAQTFPDVRLAGYHNGEDIIMGIELKGWYVLTKEGMPNFRCTGTGAACAVQDLPAVVPGALSNVLSGSPVVFKPYIESARYAAASRHYHWQVLRTSAFDSNQEADWSEVLSEKSR